MPKLKMSFFFPFFALVLILPCHTHATTYYVNPVLGTADYDGKNLLRPLKDLQKVNQLPIQAGDSILLAAGYTFSGALRLKGIQGTAEAPVVISSYQWGNTLEDKRAIIDAKGFLHGVHLTNCSHILVKDLIITADGGASGTGDMRCGILVDTDLAGQYTGIQLDHIWVKDLFFEDQGFQRGKDEVRTANGSQRYGWGIRFINHTEGATLKDLLVINCVVKNVAHTGIKFTSRNKAIENIRIYNNRVLETGGPGIQMSGISGGHIKDNYVAHSGSPDDSRKWGRGSGLWTWGSADIVIENNHFLNANGPGDSAGCHIDFNCENVVVQYNFSANNAGGFCEILGNNYNCAYRYNISVNDGHRVKGENGAFQEGKTFWLSGYQGNKKPRKGPFNSYFYNNTIYVGKDIISKIAVDKASAGVLIMNNIFYIEGESQAVLGDQYKPEQAGTATIKDIVFNNNLYLKSENWPKAASIQDKSQRIGDPRFFQAGGLDITAYIPTNIQLIKDKGLAIPRIPNDEIGLTIGLKVAHDILGNPIIGMPDLGAIELE